jgi:hypothetical protein
MACEKGPGFPCLRRAPPGEGTAWHRAEQFQQLPLAAVEGRAAGAALRACVYGVMVVANTSVRLLVLPLVCTKTDLNAVPLLASPW